MAHDEPEDNTTDKENNKDDQPNWANNNVFLEDFSLVGEADGLLDAIDTEGWSVVPTNLIEAFGAWKGDALIWSFFGGIDFFV